MEWQTPTTKEQLHQTLQDIFYYYRIRKDEWEDLALLPLELQRLEWSPLTDEQLTLRAKEEVLAQTSKEERDALAGIEQEIYACQKQAIELQTNKQTAIDKINQGYDQSVQKINVEVASRGLVNSTVALDKISQLEVERQSAIASVTLSFDNKISSVTAKESALTESITQTQEFFAKLLEERTQARKLTLKDEQDKIEREIIEYNNGQDEKEQKYQNSLIRQKASLKIKYLEIHSNFFSKDELISMGYYKAVLSCASSYYDTLDPVEAYRQISSDETVMIYLEDYYNACVILYQTRASGSI